MGDTTPWLAQDEWGARHLHQKSRMWEQPKATQNLRFVHNLSTVLGEVPLYPRAASGERSCNFARSASCTRCAEPVHWRWNKNDLFMKKKNSKQLISFCPLFQSPALPQLPGYRDVLSYSNAHSPALTSLLIFSSIHCPRVNCQYRGWVLQQHTTSPQQFHYQ